MRQRLQPPQGARHARMWKDEPHVRELASQHLADRRPAHGSCSLAVRCGVRQQGAYQPCPESPRPCRKMTEAVGVRMACCVTADTAYGTALLSSVLAAVMGELLTGTSAPTDTSGNH